MEDCLLCKGEKADKKNSHIIPHFLLKRIENIEGKTTRGNEIGFTIQNDVKSNFGQSILGEKLDEIYDDLTDEKIELLKVHPLIEDNIFCQDCEKKLGVLESEYSKNIVLNNINLDEINYSKTCFEISLLFWSSVIWRASISKDINLKIAPFPKEKLRRLLNTFLNEKIENINFTKLKKNTDFKSFNYKLIRSYNYSTSNPTYLNIDGNFNKPYFLLIDEFILFFYYREKDTDFNKIDFLDNESKLEIQSMGFNKIDKSELFLLKNDRFLNTINEKHINLLSKNWIHNTLRRLTHILKPLPSSINKNKIINEIMDELTNNNSKIGDKYSNENFIKITKTILEKYAT